MASAPHTGPVCGGTRHVHRRSAISASAGPRLQDGDTSEAPRTAIINEALARQAFRDSDPLGRVIFCPWTRLIR